MVAGEIDPRFRCQDGQAGDLVLIELGRMVRQTEQRGSFCKSLRATFAAGYRLCSQP